MWNLKFIHFVIALSLSTLVFAVGLALLSTPAQASEFAADPHLMAGLIALFGPGAAPYALALTVLWLVLVKLRAWLPAAFFARLPTWLVFIWDLLAANYRSARNAKDNRPNKTTKHRP